MLKGCDCQTITSTDAYKEQEENICEKLLVNFVGNPFGVNGKYFTDHRSGREGWIRGGFRIYPGINKRQPYWFLTVPYNANKNFIYASRKTDCPSE